MIGPTFDALADSYRRQLLISLLDNQPQRGPRLSGIDRDTASEDERVTGQRLAGSPAITGDDSDRFDEHCAHLSKLADYGYVEWDRADQVVLRGPRFDEIRPVLELLVGRRGSLTREDLTGQKPAIVSGQPDEAPGEDAAERIRR